MGRIQYENWGVSQDAIPRGTTQSDKENLRPKLQSARGDLLKSHEDSTLGYLNLPSNDVTEFLEFAKKSDHDTVLLIGIGGSSLGPRAVVEAWNGTPTKRLVISENIDPNAFIKVVKDLDPKTTLVCVITKSGSTIETMAKFWHVWEHFSNKVEHPSKHFVAITDPKAGPLRSLCPQLGIASFEVPPNIGGRFSIMSAVGLAPLALIGYPIQEFLNGAQAVVHEFKADASALFACAEDHYLLYRQGFGQTVIMPYVESLSGFSEWFCQLWGESLGKRFNQKGEEIRIGLTPIRALGPIDQHSQVQLYVEGPLNKHIVLIENRSWTQIVIPESGLPESLSHLHGKTFDSLIAAELDGTKAALRDAGCPVSKWIVEDTSPETIGALMMTSMIVTSLVGYLFDINPYDQPGVELGKRVAHGLLGRAGFEKDAELASSEKQNLISLV